MRAVVYLELARQTKKTHKTQTKPCTYHRLQPFWLKSFLLKRVRERYANEFAQIGMVGVVRATMFFVGLGRRSSATIQIEHGLPNIPLS